MVKTVALARDCLPGTESRSCSFCSVTPDKSLDFSVPQHPLWQDGDNNSTYVIDDYDDYLSGHMG